MQIEKIHKMWGEVWHVTRDELFSLPADFYRNQIYKSRLIIIKSVGKLTLEEIYFLMDKFGAPWKSEQYKDSRERFIEKEYNQQSFTLTTFDNGDSLRNKKIPNSEMPWHSDIPNHDTAPFPHRLLYMNTQPDSSYGKTRWLNVDLDILKLSSDQITFFNECSVLQQSWWEQGKNLQHLPFIKTHPIIPDRKSLRLNFYVDGKNPGTSGAWILKSFYAGNEISNQQLVGNTINDLYQRSDLVYEHTWDIGDIAVYDNWSFVHGRSALMDESNALRQFIRGNIDHQTDLEFSNKEFFKL
jgi:alpha-ketoglutarate-dependent taurine dioxygenase